MLVEVKKGNSYWWLGEVLGVRIRLVEMRLSLLRLEKNERVLYGSRYVSWCKRGLQKESY